MISRHAEPLQFIHISSHTLFAHELPCTLLLEPSIQEELQKSGGSVVRHFRYDLWTQNSCAQAQWILNTCPNVVHLELAFFSPVALDWWFMQSWPNPGTLSNLRHTRLETLAFMLPVKAELGEHARVQAIRVATNHDVTVTEERLIDAEFFASFNRTGLPSLRNVILIQLRLEFCPALSDVKSWHKELKGKGLSMGFSVIGDLIRGDTSPPVYWVTGNESDEEWNVIHGSLTFACESYWKRREQVTEQRQELEGRRSDPPSSDSEMDIPEWV